MGRTGGRGNGGCLQQEKAKLADGLLADADIVKKLNASMIRELLG